ncbi:sugar ABC transporter substrate-binding protein [Jiangella ureilytica]|uniref:Sugar ABC transporter substrate-binding protein n=1 Tax=Jiangella ureilytica TaxID=2530374 RepID=A0A4R4RL56_9ACTN|nr:sugar ABC transporter substrate-binding protein [Jiangella ureilytica]TDC50280.1 sugar ABC transporter substrate-binding protein [Jiangella ureilytica]
MRITPSARTRFITVSLVAGLAASLTACGSLGGGGDDSGDDDATAEGDGVISFMHYYGEPHNVPLEAALDEFAAANDVEIDVRHVPFPDFNRTLQQAAAADELPDIALINAFDTQQMAEAEIIQDLSDRVEEWGEQDAYYPTSWQTTQVDGATYGIPHVADDYAVYYNADLLAAAGVEPPQTWEDMEEAAAALSQNGAKYGLAVSGREGAEGATGILLRALAAGGDLETFGDEAGVEALESFGRMVENGGLSEGFLTWSEDDAKNHFATGQAAMMINSATYVNILREEVPDLNWDVAPIPTDQTSRTFLSAENLTITEGSGDEDLAWDLITYLQQPDVLETYLPARNKLPARNDVPGAVEDPIRKKFADQLENAWAPEGQVATNSEEMLVLVQEALQATISGSASAADAAATAQVRIDEALAGS